MNNLKVKNITSSSGNRVANQIIIEYTDEVLSRKVKIFQSYDSVIVKQTEVTEDDLGRTYQTGEYITYLDDKYWNYSVTTGKYRNIFLGEDQKATEAKIKSGEYKLINLN